MARQKLGSSQTGWATTVWIDPGGISGWGVMSMDPYDLLSDAPLHKCIANWTCGEIMGEENAQTSEILELWDMWDDAAIGMEKFTIRKFLQHSEFLSPVRIRAKAEYGLWLAEKWQAQEDGRLIGRPRHVFLQEPNLAKSTLTDDRQRDWDLWVPGRDHKRDAIKHCYTFMSRARSKARMRAYAWPNLFKMNGDPIKRLPPTSKAASRGRKS